MITPRTWDEPKRQANLEKHGLDFAALVDFDATNAMFSEDVRGQIDARFIYPERWSALKPRNARRLSRRLSRRS